MSIGPILIFDKSTLESLNPDEAVWLDNFFLTNITPLFFIETLADLEKEVRSGRTPEHVVGSLAYKTPDMGSRPNVYHETLLVGELTGVGKIDMRYGRPHIAGGKTVEIEGKTGIIFQQAPEEEALQRWQCGEFLDLERLWAKTWRRALSSIDFEKKYKLFQGWFTNQEKPKTISEVKNFVDSIIDESNQESVFRYGLTLLNISSHLQTQVLSRWQSAGRPLIREFAPYFRHVFSVDLFFYLAIAADLISRNRPSHKIDIAYLYYLPFCMVFTSNDNLHAGIVPLFLRTDQTFVRGVDLKIDFDKLDQYYSSLPEDVKNKGLYHFATCPPPDSSFLVTQLWDKYLPLWRKHQAEPKKSIDRETEVRIIDEMKHFEDDAVSTNSANSINSDDTHCMLIHRNVYARKGKWKRFSPEVEQANKN